MTNRKPFTNNLRIPLFDRLVDTRDETQKKMGGDLLSAYDKSAFKESIRIALQRLLNTRCSVTVDVYLEKDLTVIDYGIPDISNLFSLGHDGRQTAAEIITVAINAFEPRLKDPKVVVEKTKDSALEANVDAALFLAGDKEHVSFPTIRLSMEKSSV